MTARPQTESLSSFKTRWTSSILMNVAMMTTRASADLRFAHRRNRNYSVR